MQRHQTRKFCTKEAIKQTPVIADVKIEKIPYNFPEICRKMIGKSYPAIVYMDRKGRVWYKILKELVIKKEREFSMMLAPQKIESNKVSFENRKYMTLPARYCK